MRTVVSLLITFRGMLDGYQPCTNSLDSVFQNNLHFWTLGFDDKSCIPL